MLRGRRYPPVATDAKEHMAVELWEPGAFGAGTRLSSERARADAAELLGPRDHGNEREPGARQGRGLGNFADA